MLPSLIKKFMVFYFLAFLLVSNLTLFHCQLNHQQDNRCPAISTYQLMPSVISNRYTSISSTLLKKMSVYFFKDFVQLMSAEAVNFLVYSGVISIIGYALMFAWGCIYFPYALFRAIIRYGLMILVVLTIFGLLSGFGGSMGGQLEQGNVLGNVLNIGSSLKAQIFGDGNNQNQAANGFIWNMVKNQGLDMVKSMLGFGGGNGNNQQQQGYQQGNGYQGNAYQQYQRGRNQQNYYHNEYGN